MLLSLHVQSNTRMQLTAPFLHLHRELNMLHLTPTPHLMPRQESGFIEAAPAAMHVGSKIEGHGPAVVLLHSSMASKSQWRTLMESMRGTHRLIAIDLHGYGDSAMPASCRRHSLVDEVRLVQLKLAQVLGPGDRFHLVGHSFGGGVALRLAYANPERVRSLTLYEPTAFHLLEQDDAVLNDVRTVAHATRVATREGKSLGATEVFIDFWSGKGAFAALPPARQALF